MTAEDLGIAVDSVSIVEGDTALVPDHGWTGGSSGIPRGAVDVRQAAATARQAILNLGAAQLSREVKQPVRVQWMREDEHGWDPKGPPQLLELRGGLDAQGRIVAWDTQMWIPATVPGARPLLAADSAGIPQAHGQGSGAISQNGDPPYAADNVP